MHPAQCDASGTSNSRAASALPVAAVAASGLRVRVGVGSPRTTTAEVVLSCHSGDSEHSAHVRLQTTLPMLLGVGPALATPGLLFSGARAPKRRSHSKEVRGAGSSLKLKFPRPGAVPEPGSESRLGRRQAATYRLWTSSGHIRLAITGRRTRSRSSLKLALSTSDYTR